MNLIILLLLIMMYNLYSIDLNYSKYKIKTFGLRFLVFKKKSVPIIFKNLKYFYNKCYYKSVASIGEGVINYNKLSEEDKLIIETILSLS